MTECDTAAATFTQDLLDHSLPGQPAIGDADVQRMHTEFLAILAACPDPVISDAAGAVGTLLLEGVISTKQAEAITGGTASTAPYPGAGVFDTLTDWFDMVKLAVGVLFDPETWIRAGETVLGALLIVGAAVLGFLYLYRRNEASAKVAA
jgi:hypothetical protein